MKRLLFLAILLIASAFDILTGQTPFNEKIDRGVIALTIDGTYAYIGWRLLKDDPAVSPWISKLHNGIFLSAADGFGEKTMKNPLSDAVNNKERGL